MNPAVSPLMLHVIDEVSEANKAYLSDAFADKTEVDILTNSFNFNRFKAYIKDKFEDEIADFILLGFSIAGYYNIKIGKHLGLKQKFNIERKEHSVTNNYNNTSK
jgi:NTP pyrophosphatase (non-canonical NTP hydrolase)